MNFPEKIHLLDIDNDMCNIIQHMKKHYGELDSYYVCDIGDIVVKYRKWQQCLPHIKPYYSVRCNNNIVMMELMAAFGSRFGCASKNEIKEVLNLGVNAENIIFSHPLKLESHIRYAAAVGVKLLAVHHEKELPNIKRLYPEAKLLIHIKATATKAVHSSDEIGYKLESVGTLLIDTAQSLRLEIVGVTLHVDSSCLEYEALQRAIAGVKNIFTYGAKLGYKFGILNIAGDFSENTGTTFTELAKNLKVALEEHFPDSSSVAIEAEIGHFYANSAFSLVTSINSKKELISKNQGQGTTTIIYYINNGIYNNFGTLDYATKTSVPVPKVVTVKGTTDKIAVSTIFGTTCDSTDMIMKDKLFPVTDTGDYVIFQNMGAYTLTSATVFNGFSVSKVHIFVDEHLWVKLSDMLPLTKRNYSFTNIPGKLIFGRYKAVTESHEVLDR